MTGHVELNKQLFNLKKISSPLCACGEDDESDDHYLLRCPIYARQRLQLFGEPSIEEQDACNIKLIDILRFILDTKRLKVYE